MKACLGKRPPENTFGIPDRIAGQRREPLHAYNGVQLTAMKRLGHGLQGKVNYTWSRCMDTDSNGRFLPFSAR